MIERCSEPLFINIFNSNQYFCEQTMKTLIRLYEYTVTVIYMQKKKPFSHVAKQTVYME